MTDQPARTILLVEDEETPRMVLQSALEAAGYRVIAAQDGKDGLSKAIAEHPNLILTDLKMPNMTGLEMIAELRKDPWGKSAQIIILTNVSDADALQEAMSQNTFYYINKGDSSIENIVSRVKTHLQA